MGGLRVFLFGRLVIERDGVDQTEQFPHRAQELLCYLLINRSQPYLRENLVDVLWGDDTNSHPRKMFRQVLWQLQTALGKCVGTPTSPDTCTSDCLPATSPTATTLTLEGDWIGLNAQAPIDTDVASFERAIDQAQHAAQDGALERCAIALRQAVDLYMGDLLPAWYCDWCLRDRERLQILYLNALERLTDCCERQQNYAEGLSCVERILQLDAVHERAYQQSMRLHYLRGDRASALRQYERCAKVLQAELGITPGRQTLILLEQIRQDNLELAAQDPLLFINAPAGASTTDQREALASAESISPADLLHRLLRLQTVLASAQAQLAQDLCALQHWLGTQ